MTNKNVQQRQLAEYMEKANRDAAKLDQLWAGLDDDVEFVEKEYSSRYDVPCPDPLDKSKYNPYGYVDIVTFITHPHFLNLNPYPWQTLALKLFYRNTEGNTDIDVNCADKNEEKDCSKCVWKYVIDNEVDCANKINNGESYNNLLDPTNSRCLACKRCPLNVRSTRIKHEVEKASSKTTEKILSDILDDDHEDLFQSEMDLIEAIPDEAVRQQIKNKLENRFQELVLIMGRRSGKSFMTVVIALYETYKLLKMGHCQKKLGLPDFQEIHILNVAKNEGMAKDSIFTPMKSNAVASPFFQKYIGVDNALEMKFLTEKDLEENERRSKKGLAPLDGTLILQCGSSSAKGLVGKTCWCIIIDELAALAGDNPDSGQDKQLYTELKPSITTFGKDGKIICLSNPKGPFGQLFNLYTTRLDDPVTLVLKLPTWLINANVSKDWLEGERKKDPVEFNMQYGAEFGTNSADPFLSPEDVEAAFINSAQTSRAEARTGVHDYYCHVDPANKSDYYAIAVCHAEKTGEKDSYGKEIKKFIVDHIQFWAPIQMKQPVQVGDVETYLIDLHQKFQFKQISFDQWHSQDTISKLQSAGLPAVLRVFNKEYKDKIYINLLEAFRNKRIEFYKLSSGKAKNKRGELIDIYEIPEAKDQFTFLQKKWKNGRQVIEALTGYKDDICDAVAACIHECSMEHTIVKSLPKARLSYTGRSLR
jgi:hypothetical protein